MTTPKSTIKATAKRTLAKCKAHPHGRAYTDDMKRATVERILAAWQKQPDMRLTQFIIAACGVDPFYVEDEHVAAACERLVKGEK